MYDLNRWQWAMKLAAFLRDNGHDEVEILTTDDEDVDDEVNDYEAAAELDEEDDEEG